MQKKRSYQIAANDEKQINADVAEQMTKIKRELRDEVGRIRVDSDSGRLEIIQQTELQQVPYDYKADA